MIQLIRLKAERIKRGWSQKDLSNRTNINQTEISRIENRRGVIFDSYLKRLSDLFNVEKELLTKDVELDVIE